jgi:dephospho-CoA kinase
MAFEYAIALTGGIATGKSTVAKIFREFGFTIIDADKIAHCMLDSNYKKIAELFGSKYIVDFRVDRKALGKLIFSDKKAKKILEELLHPLIYKEIERLSKKEDIKKRTYLVDIPLFFETNRYPIQKSIVVYIPAQKQLERLIIRDNCTKEEAKQRIDSQLDIESKKSKATYLIDNSQDLKSLQEECDRVKEQIVNDF